MEVFWERGYEGASVAELTEAIGIAAPSLYAAFGSKQNLFREAVALYDSREGSLTERALRSGPTARSSIEAMLRDNARMYADPETPSGCLVVLGATTWTPGNKAVRDYLAGLRRQTFEVGRARLERGVADGDVRADADISAIAAYYRTVLEGLSIQARDGATLETMNAIIDCAMAGWDRLAAPRE
jgi:AcrR family transcriptional regulator